MSAYRKLGIGLGLIVLSVLSFSFMSTKVRAATFPTLPDAQKCEATAKFISIAEIDCETTQGTVKFIDVQPDDSSGGAGSSFSIVNKANFAPQSLFCAPPAHDGNIEVDDWHTTAAITLKYPPGFSRESTGGDGASYDDYAWGQGYTTSDAGKPTKMRLNIGYRISGSTECKRYGDGNNGKEPIITDTGGIKNFFKFDGDSIVSLDGVDKGELSSKSFSRVTGYKYGANTYIFSSGDYTNCDAELLKITVDDNNKVTEAHYYKLNGGALTKQSYPVIYDFLTQVGVTKSCGVDSTKTDFGYTGSGGFDILGTFTPPAAGEVLDKTPPKNTSDEDVCAQKGEGWGFTWIACPFFSLASGLSDQLIKTFEGQASFTMSQLTKTHKTDSGTLHDAWASIRNVASAFLVVILLVAVISQALSFGPFDAYTIRKMLPRIVVAIILMQFSWVLVSTLVNIAYTIGNGLQDLMYAPFNSGGQLNKLGALFFNAGFSGSDAETINWLAMTGIIVASVAALPTIIAGMFAGIVALTVGLVALIFRKILIMMLVLFAPIAFLLWILPGAGTQRYYKLWSENLMKSLMMYPLIILLISGGRVFAWVAGGDGGIVAFFTVMIGFFGPMFILPKTYKWGGSIMTTAGGAISNGMAKASKPASDYLNWRKGISRWATARNTRKAILERKARTDFAEGITSGRLSGLRRARLVGISPHERLVQRKAMMSGQAEVAKAFDEELQGATAELTQVTLPEWVAKGASHDLMREAIGLRKKMIVGKDAKGNDLIFDGANHAKNHPLSQRAAMDRAVIHGQWGLVDQYLTEAKNGTVAEQGAADGFRNSSSNAPAIGQKLTHQLKGYSVAVASTENDIAAMSGHEVESIIAEYTTRITEGRTSGDPAKQAAGLQAEGDFKRFRDRFASAKTNPNIHLDSRAMDSMDAFETGNVAGIDDINTGSGKEADALARGDDSTKEEITREGSRERYGLKTIKII